MLYTLIGIFILILILLITPHLNKKSLIVLSVFLILNKGIELIYGLIQGNFYKIPIEFSTITYFMLPIAILTKKQTLIDVFVFFGFLAGFSYLILFIFSGNTIYTLNGLYNTVQGLINHSAILVLGLYFMKYYPRKHLALKIWIITWMLVIYMFAISFIIDYSDRSLFVARLLKGTFFVNLFNPIFTKYSILVYYLLLIIVYHFIIQIYIIINKRFSHQINKRDCKEMK